MSVAGSLDGEVLTIAVRGSVDVAAQTTLYLALSDALLTHPPVRLVVLDLADLDFCDCAGARTLGRVHRLAVARGSVCRVRRPQPHIAWLLRQVPGIAGPLRLDG